MKTYKLAAQPRTDLGKKAAKTLRAEGKIPVVLNGGEIVKLPFEGALKPGEKIIEIEKDMEGNRRGVISTDLEVTNDDVRRLIYTPEIFAIEIEINGEKKEAVLREVQFHPVKDTILHIDLLEVGDKKPVVMSVPVKLVGHAAGVKAGGKLVQSLKRIKVRALYNEMPERLDINVDDLGLGKAIAVGDLHFPHLEMVTPKEAVVCSVAVTRAARGAADDAAEAAK